MKPIVTRTISGIVFLAILLSGLLINSWIFLIVFSVIVTGCLWEFYTIITTDSVKPMRIIPTLTGLAIFQLGWLMSLGYIGYKYVLIVFPLLTLFFVVELFRKKKYPFQNIAVELLGIIYLALPLALSCFIIHQKGTEFNAQGLLGYFILLWTYDTGAYLFGMAFGKHRLFERISPKKSWEGAIGGTLSAIALSWGLSFWFPIYGLTDWFIIGSIAVVMGTFGDLTESMLKRSLQIKDSGSIMPGHGGFLDRFDAVFLGLPFVFVYVLLFVK